MKLKESAVKRILVISLTNIGDCILTLPVMDILRRDFKDAELSVVIGPKSASLLQGSLKLKKVYIYDKHQPAATTIRWVLALRRQRFDLVVDLRNSFTPFLIGARWRTPAAKIKQEHLHMKDKHLKRLQSVYNGSWDRSGESVVHISSADKKHVDQLLERTVGSHRPFIALAPGSAYHAKRWAQENFAQLVEEANIRFQLPIVFVGDAKDTKVVSQINALLPIAEADLTGQTTLTQLAEILKRAKLLISNDSAPMHLASYLNRPVLALFGPSDPKKYGPWSERSGFLQAPGGDGVSDLSAITTEAVLSRLEYNNNEFSIR